MKSNYGEGDDLLANPSVTAPPPTAVEAMSRLRAIAESLDGTTIFTLREKQQNEIRGVDVRGITVRTVRANKDALVRWRVIAEVISELYLRGEVTREGLRAKRLSGSGRSAFIFALLVESGLAHVAPNSPRLAIRCTSSNGRPPEVLDAIDAIGTRSSQRTNGQRFRLSAAARAAIENHAMSAAISHYRNEGWEVDDVHGSQSYDLSCRRRGAQMRVEVKGTTSGGAEILLTPNEVEHAREQYPKVSLFVVADIELSGDEPTYSAHGGNTRVYEPWNIDTGELSPIGFVYAIGQEPAHQ